jgi:hypothetical protein
VSAAVICGLLVELLGATDLAPVRIVFRGLDGLGWYLPEPVGWLLICCRGGVLCAFPGLVSRRLRWALLGFLCGAAAEWAMVAVLEHTRFVWSTRGVWSGLLHDLFPPMNPGTGSRPNFGKYGFTDVFTISVAVWTGLMLAICAVLYPGRRRIAWRALAVLAGAGVAAIFGFTLCWAAPMGDFLGQRNQPGWPTAITLPLIIAAIPVSAAVGAAILAHAARTPWPANICPRCEYDLRGSPGPTCPECGEPIRRRN